MTPESKKPPGANPGNGNDARMPDDQLKQLTRWTWVVSLALILAVGGSLWKLKKLEPLELLQPGPTKSSVVVNVEGGAGKPETPPPQPQSAPPGVVLDLDVNAVAGPPSAGAWNGSGSPGATQTVTLSGAPVTVRSAPGGSPINVVAGSGGPGRAEGTPEPEHPLCTRPSAPPGVPGPCAKAEFLDRIEFEEGSRRIHSSASEPGRIVAIATKLAGRTGTVLVIGHEDSCGSSFLAGRRAKKARRALRRLLKSSAEWRSGALRIHAQAAGEDPGAPEAVCVHGYFGTAGVYLVGGLK